MKYFISRTALLTPFLGFYFATFLVHFGLPSYITVIERFVAMVFCLVVIFQNKSIISKYNIYFSLFLLYYLFKLVKDLLFTDLDFGRSSTVTFFFAFGVTIIPALAFLSSSIKKQFVISGNYLRLGFSFLTIIFLVLNVNDSGRLSGNSLLNPITVGHLAVSSLMINLLLIFESKKSFFRTHFFSIIFLIISIITLFFSASRGPILSFIVCILTYVLISRNINKWFLIFGVSFLFIGVPMLVNFTTDSGFILSDRLQVNYNSDTVEDEIRVFLWKEAVDIFLDSPIIGESTTTKFGYVHNFYLELLHSTGLVGLFLYLIPFSKAIANISLHLKSNNIYMKWLALLFVQYLVGSLFSGTIYSNDFYWILFALMISEPILLRSNKIGGLEKSDSRY